MEELNAYREKGITDLVGGFSVTEKIGAAGTEDTAGVQVWVILGIAAAAAVILGVFVIMKRTRVKE